MAKKEVGPGAVCRVIGGNKGPASPNIGRIVKVLNRHPNPKPHSLWGVIWQCAAQDGLGFQIHRDQSEEYGTGKAMQNIADLPTDWLEPLEDDELNIKEMISTAEKLFS